MQLRRLYHTEGLDDIVDVWSETLDCCPLLGGKIFGSLSRHQTVRKIPSHVLVEVSDHVQVDRFLKDVPGAHVDALIVVGDERILEEESLAEGKGSVLNIIICLVHPDVEELFFFFQNELLQFSCNILKLYLFSEVD